MGQVIASSHVNGIKSNRTRHFIHRLIQHKCSFKLVQIIIKYIYGMGPHYNCYGGERETLLIYIYQVIRTRTYRNIIVRITCTCIRLLATLHSKLAENINQQWRSCGKKRRGSVTKPSRDVQEL